MNQTLNLVSLWRSRLIKMKSGKKSDMEQGELRVQNGLIIEEGSWEVRQVEG